MTTIHQSDLRRYRVEHIGSRIKFAKLMNVSTVTAWAWETCRRRMNFEHRERFAILFGVTVAYLDNPEGKKP